MELSVLKDDSPVLQVKVIGVTEDPSPEKLARLQEKDAAKALTRTIAVGA